MSVKYFVMARVCCGQSGCAATAPIEIVIPYFIEDPECHVDIRLNVCFPGNALPAGWVTDRYGSVYCPDCAMLLGKEVWRP